MLLAVTMTAVGFAYDAGSGAKELSMVFAAAYAIGCVAAVLAVRQAGLFTAVIQPPLILFVAVPTAYFLFHGSQITGIKDTLINFGYPLIERFPVMFFTSAAVLLIGMARWYYGMSTRRASPSSAEESTGTGFTSKMSSLFSREPADEAAADEADAPRRKHTIERPSRPAKAAAANSSRTGRPTKRASTSRSRHARPPDTEIIEPVAERPRRPRSTRQTESPPAERPRRPRASSTGRRAVPPSADRRTGYDRSERRRRYDDYESPEPQATNGNGTHHPISRVRYRGDADDAERRTEYRTPPRRSRREREPESWEYDI